MSLFALRPKAVRHATVPRCTRRILVLAALSTPACSWFLPPGPTPVAQGKYYASGDPEFDDFFIELYRSQVRMAELPQESKSLRHKLAESLDVAPDLPEKALLSHVNGRAKDLSKKGRKTQLKVVRKTENGDERGSTAVLLSRPQKRDATLRAFAGPVERAANAQLAIVDELGALQKTLDKLDGRRIELEARTSETFGKKSALHEAEVRENLDDAAKVIVLMRGQSEEQLDEASKFLEQLAEASTTAQVPLEAPEEADEEESSAPTPKKRPPPQRRRSNPRPVPRSRPVPAPKPPPPPPPSAPPEFEP